MTIGALTWRGRAVLPLLLQAAGALRGLFPHWGMWLFLSCLTVVNLGWIAHNWRLSLSLGAVGPMLFVAIGVPLALAYRAWRRPAFDRLLDVLSRMFIVALFAGLLTQQVNLFSHLLMTLGFPLADDRLRSWDQALGFDWNGYAAAVAARPWQRGVLFAAYIGFLQPALLVIVFASLWLRRYDRVEEVSFLALASGFVCVLIAGLMPAEDAWFSVARPETQALIGGQPALGWIDQFNQLRGEGPVAFSFRTMQGLATFPSYHACLAIIVIWCSRGRWYTAVPGAVLGLLIIAATPVYGGHYGVDLLGGTAVMAVAILAWRGLAPALRRTPA